MIDPGTKGLGGCDADENEFVIEKGFTNIWIRYRPLPDAAGFLPPAVIFGTQCRPDGDNIALTYWLDGFGTLPKLGTSVIMLPSVLKESLEAFSTFKIVLKRLIQTLLHNQATYPAHTWGFPTMGKSRATPPTWCPSIG